MMDLKKAYEFFPNHPAEYFKNRYDWYHQMVKFIQHEHPDYDLEQVYLAVIEWNEWNNVVLDPTEEEDREIMRMIREMMDTEYDGYNEIFASNGIEQPIKRSKKMKKSMSENKIASEWNMVSSRHPNVSLMTVHRGNDGTDGYPRYVMRFSIMGDYLDENNNDSFNQGEAIAEEVSNEVSKIQGLQVKWYDYEGGNTFEIQVADIGDFNMLNASSKKMKKWHMKMTCPYCENEVDESRDPSGAYVAYCNHCDRPLTADEIESEPEYDENEFVGRPLRDIMDEFELMSCNVTLDGEPVGNFGWNYYYKGENDEMDSYLDYRVKGYDIRNVEGYLLGDVQIQKSVAKMDVTKKISKELLHEMGGIELKDVAEGIPADTKFSDGEPGEDIHADTIEVVEAKKVPAIKQSKKSKTAKARVGDYDWNGKGRNIQFKGRPFRVANTSLTGYMDNSRGERGLLYAVYMMDDADRTYATQIHVPKGKEDEFESATDWTPYFFDKWSDLYPNGYREVGPNDWDIPSYYYQNFGIEPKVKNKIDVRRIKDILGIDFAIESIRQMDDNHVTIVFVSPDVYYYHYEEALEEAGYECEWYNDYTLEVFTDNIGKSAVRKSEGCPTCSAVENQMLIGQMGSQGVVRCGMCGMQYFAPVFDGDDEFDGDFDDYRASSMKDIRKGIDDILNDEDSKFKYQMLSRWKADMDYYFGHGRRNESVMWASEGFDRQIDYMKRLWENLETKPEWLTMEQIEEYAKYKDMPGWYRSNGTWTQDSSQFLYGNDFLASTKKSKEPKTTGNEFVDMVDKMRNTRRFKL